MSNASRFFGKYRGTVVNNIDPMQIGRVQVIVPDVSNIVPGTWAMPCLPIAGKLMGTYMVPQIGAGVWVEFEQGDPDYPIWTGGFWGAFGELPTPALPPLSNPASPSIVFQTTAQNTLFLSDVPGPTGGIVIKSTTGASIIVNDTGIYIQNGRGASITLVGPAVTVNAGALTVI